MKITIYSSNSGSGASALTAMLFWLLKKEGRHPMYLDMSEYPAGDIYIREDLKIHKDFNMDDCSREDYVLCSDVTEDTINKIKDISDTADILIDTSTDNGRKGILQTSDIILLVMTLDNHSLRAANKVLSDMPDEILRKTKIVINKDTEKMSENRNVIYDLVENEIAGTISYSEELRYLLDQGRTDEIPEDINTDIRNIRDSIFDDNGTEDSNESDTAAETYEDVPVTESDEESTEDKPLSDDTEQNAETDDISSEDKDSKKPGVFRRFLDYFRSR